MSTEELGLLPLVGKVLKQRVSELARETKAELSEGYEQLKSELRDELGEKNAPQLRDKDADKAAADEQS